MHVSDILFVVWKRKDFDKESTIKQHIQNMCKYKRQDVFWLDITFGFLNWADKMYDKITACMFGTYNQDFKLSHQEH